MSHPAWATILGILTVRAGQVQRDAAVRITGPGNWQKLPPIEDRPACLNCGPWPSDLPKDAVLAVGCGVVTVRRDGEMIWDGDDENVTLARFERKAARDTDHDWRVNFLGPLNEREYQRQRGHWRLVRRGTGFA